MNVLLQAKSRYAQFSNEADVAYSSIGSNADTHFLRKLLFLQYHSG